MRAHSVFNRQRIPAKAAIDIAQAAKAVFTNQAGATPTLRSKNGRKFQVVM